MPSIKYNAPTTLTFTFACIAVTAISHFWPGNLGYQLFSSPSATQFDATNLMHLFRLTSHTLGHADLKHLTGNLFVILLLGPLLEEKFGSKGLLTMIVTTAFVTGLIHALFLSHSVLGASGIVFMMILLSGFTDFREGEIPLTFILVALIYLSGELIGMARNDNISQFSHLLGGACGSLFGFASARSG